MLGYLFNQQSAIFVYSSHHSIDVKIEKPYTIYCQDYMEMDGNKTKLNRVIKQNGSLSNNHQICPSE